MSNQVAPAPAPWTKPWTKPSFVFLAALIGIFVVFVVVLLLTTTTRSERAAALPIERVLNTHALGVDEIARMKFQHAIRHPKMQLGIFGNSRSVMIGAQDTGRDPASFFNFSVPGASFRDSVALVEALAAHDRLPAIAIISFDNFELQYFAHPTFPPPVTRWVRGASDAYAMARTSAPPRDVVRAVWRTMWTEWQQLRETLNVERQQWFMFHPLLDRGADVTHWQSDGSSKALEQVIVEPNANRALALRMPPAISTGLLAIDLQRLEAAARKTRSQIVIYESPLEPLVAERLMQQPAPYVQSQRQFFRDQCALAHLICESAPKIEGAWRDATHPPSLQIGSYVRQLSLRRNVSAAALQ